MAFGISSTAHAEIALLLHKTHQLTGMGKAADFLALHICRYIATQCQNIFYAKAMQLSKYLCQLCFVSLYTSQMSQSRHTVILYFFGQCCRIAYRAAACAIGDAHIGRLAGSNPVDNLQTVLQLCALLRRKQLARQMNFTVF